MPLHASIIVLIRTRSYKSIPERCRLVMQGDSGLKILEFMGRVNTHFIASSKFSGGGVGTACQYRCSLHRTTDALATRTSLYSVIVDSGIVDCFRHHQDDGTCISTGRIKHDQSVQS